MNEGVASETLAPISTMTMLKARKASAPWVGASPTPSPMPLTPSLMPPKWPFALQAMHQVAIETPKMLIKIVLGRGPDPN